MKQVELSRAAEIDYEDALQWYREQAPHVAARFSSEVRNVLQFIEQFPSTGSLVPGATRQPKSRRHPVKGFPYHVVFVDVGPYIEVLAIAHDRKRPAYWEG